MDETSVNQSQQQSVLRDDSYGRGNVVERKSSNFMTRLKQTLDFRSSGPEPKSTTGPVSKIISRTVSSSAAEDEFRPALSKDDSMLYTDSGKKKTGVNKRVYSFSLQTTPSYTISRLIHPIHHPQGSIGTRGTGKSKLLMTSIQSLRSGNSSERVVQTSAATVEQRDAVGNNSPKSTKSRVIGPADRWLQSTSTIDGSSVPRAGTEQLAARGHMASDVDRDQFVYNCYWIQRQNSEMKQLGGRSDSVAAAAASNGRTGSAFSDVHRDRPGLMNFASPAEIDDQCSPDSAYHSPFNGSNTTLSVYGSVQQNGFYGNHQRWVSSRFELNQKGHEKSPSWPPGDQSSTATMSSSGVSSRTSSWSGNASSSSQTAASEFTLAPRLLAGSRVDEPPSQRSGPYAMKGYEDVQPSTVGVVRRQRLRVEADSQSSVSTQLMNYPPEVNGNNIEQSRRRPQSDFFPVGEMKRQSSMYARAVISRDSSGTEDSPLVPPPLPATSPPRGAIHSTSAPERPPYTMRLRPFYNTSTQTDPPGGDQPLVGDRISSNGGDKAITDSHPRYVMKTSQSYSSAVPSSKQTADFVSSSASELGSSLPLQLTGCQPPDDCGTPTFIDGDTNGVIGRDRRNREYSRSKEDLVDQTKILRRLSKELYGQQSQQSRYGVPTVRTSVDAGVSNVQFGKRPSDGNRKSDNRFESPSADNGTTSAGESRLDGRDVTPDAVESNFIRSRKTQMSLRKAFGIFEEIGGGVGGETMLTVSETAEDPDLLHPNRALDTSRGTFTSGDENQLRSMKERRTSDSGGYQQRRQRGTVGASSCAPDVDLPMKMRAMSMTDSCLHTSSVVQNRSSDASDVHSSFSSSSGSGSAVGIGSSAHDRTSNADSVVLFSPSYGDVPSPVWDASNCIQQPRIKQKSVSLPRGMTPPDSSYFGISAFSSHNTSFTAYENSVSSYRQSCLENEQNSGDNANKVQSRGKTTTRLLSPPGDCDGELSVSRHIEAWSGSNPQDQESYGDIHSPPAPALPPRRYRVGADQPSSCVAASTNIDCGEATIHPDTYANKLREQSRRYSQPRLSSFNQSKPSAPPTWRPPPPPMLQSNDDSPSKRSRLPPSSQPPVSSVSTYGCLVLPQKGARTVAESERSKPSTNSDISLDSSESSLSSVVPYSVRDKKVSVDDESSNCRNSASENDMKISSQINSGTTSVKSRLVDSEDDDERIVGRPVPATVSMTTYDNATDFRENVSELEKQSSSRNIQDSTVPPFVESLVDSRMGRELEMQASPREVSTFNSSAVSSAWEAGSSDSSSTYADVTQIDQPARINTGIRPSYDRTLYSGRKLDTAIVAPSVRESSAKDGSCIAPSLKVSERNTELGVTNGNANATEDSNKRITCEMSMPKNFCRRRLSEEMEYDRHASLFVKRLKNFDRDRQLVDVISPPSDCKMPIDFLTLDYGKKQPYDESHVSESLRLRLTARTARHRSSLRDVSTANICSTGPSPMLQDFVHNPRTAHDWMTNGGMETDKGILIDLLERKLSALRQQKQLLDEEIVENNSLGVQLDTASELKLQSREREKYQQIVHDVDKVTCLLLKLSDMLARAENAVRVLPESCTSKEKERLVSKTSDLTQKHEDARLLKDDIDVRSRPITNMLYQSLSPSEFFDYQYFILMKSQLAIELQDVEQAIQLGDRQLQLLHSSANILALHTSDC